MPCETVALSGTAVPCALVRLKNCCKFSVVEATCSEPEKVRHIEAGLVCARSKSLPTVMLGAAYPVPMPIVAMATATAQLNLLNDTIMTP